MLSLRSGADHSEFYSFRDPAALKLRNRRQDVHLELARRRRGVDPFTKAHEGNLDSWPRSAKVTGRAGRENAWEFPSHEDSCEVFERATGVSVEGD